MRPPVLQDMVWATEKVVPHLSQWAGRLDGDSVSVAKAVLEFLGSEGGVLEGVGCEGEPAACPGGAKELQAVSRGGVVADAFEGALAFKLTEA